MNNFFKNATIIVVLVLCFVQKSTAQKTAQNIPNSYSNVKISFASFEAKALLLLKKFGKTNEQTLFIYVDEKKFTVTSKHIYPIGTDVSLIVKRDQIEFYHEEAGRIVKIVISEKLTTLKLAENPPTPINYYHNELSHIYDLLLKILNTK